MNEIINNMINDLESFCNDADEFIKKIKAKQGRKTMSEEIEERLLNIYNFNIKVELYKGIFGKYEIKIELNKQRGFSFVYNYSGYYTFDKNIEEICNIIDGMIIDNYKIVNKSSK